LIEQCSDFESTAQVENRFMGASAYAFDGKHRRFGIRTLPVNEKTYKKVKKVLLLLAISRSQGFPDERLPAMRKCFAGNRTRAPRPRLHRRRGSDGICRDLDAEL